MAPACCCAAFGGGTSQAAFGARAGATLLSKLTTGFAVLFMLGALGLAIIGQRGTGSVLSSSAPPDARNTINGGILRSEANSTVAS